MRSAFWAVAVAAALVVSGCGDETAESSPTQHTARRMAPVDGQSVERLASSFRARACACPDASCARKTLVAIGDFGRKQLGLTLDADAQKRVTDHVDAALACIQPKLQTP